MPSQPTTTQNKIVEIEIHCSGKQKFVLFHIRQKDVARKTNFFGIHHTCISKTNQNLAKQEKHRPCLTHPSKHTSKLFWLCPVLAKSH